MFTIPTLPKLLLIVLVIGAVWWFYRRSQIKRRQQDELDRNPRTRTKTSKPAKPIEDMKQCRICNAYVPGIGASRCGRENCPF
jgi:Na+/H+ antiporter NhaD/arsenite permease-like protein